MEEGWGDLATSSNYAKTHTSNARKSYKKGISSPFRANSTVFRQTVRNDAVTQSSNIFVF
eukprot:scaffold743_cov117-Cylindrotheca_fusiformis.AAC.12